MLRQIDDARDAPSGERGIERPVLLSNRAETRDQLGVEEAIRPLAELCLSPDAQTPFALGIVGAGGAGKSFALRRLLEAVAARAGENGPVKFLNDVLVAEVDAPAIAADPESGIAAALYAALERGREGRAYRELAEEAAHAGVDPSHAASAAAERHDEISRRLEQAREARDEVETRRARLPETLLLDTPGSRVDAFARSRRVAIDRRLRGFGFAEGDAYFRSLVADLGEASAASRGAIFVRAIFAYRGQAALLVASALAFAAAVGLNWLASPSAAERLTAVSAQTAPAADWLQSHTSSLGYASGALVATGFLALAFNLWRAASFTALVFRGVRLLHLDVRERKRELDASAARLERRVTALQLETEAASRRAEALARRAGSVRTSVSPAPGPVFISSTEAPRQAACNFLRELGIALPAAVSAGASAPQRVFVVLDALDLTHPDDTRRILETAKRRIGPGVVLLAACDLGRLGADPRQVAEEMFDAVWDVSAGADAQTLAQRLFGEPPHAATPVVTTAHVSLHEPLGDDELRALTLASVLVGPRPRALKRYFNAYRLARTQQASRPAIAFALAAQMSDDADVTRAWRESAFAQGGLRAPASAPPTLAAGFETLGLQRLDSSAAQAAWSAARRYAPGRD